MSKKKLITILAVLSALLVVAVASVVIVLVAGGNNISSNISIQYTSDGIMVDVSGSYTIGSTKTAMVAKRDGTNIGSVLSITPQAKTGELSPSGNISLTNDNTSVMFEFVFTNTDTEADIELALTGTPSASNVLVKYVALDYAMTNPDAVEGESSFANTLVATGKTKYVYVIVSLISHMYNATYSGSITWSMTRASVNSVSFGNISGLDNASAFANGAKFLQNTNIYESQMPLPTKVGSVFRYWANSSTSSTAVSFPTTTATTFYPVFIQGNVPSANYTWDSATGTYSITGSLASSFTSSTFVIPDYYNDGTHGVAKVATFNLTNWFKNNTSVTEVYIGNNITNDFQLEGTSITKVHMGRCSNNIKMIYKIVSKVATLEMYDPTYTVFDLSVFDYADGWTDWNSALKDKVILATNNSDYGYFLRANTTITSTSAITNWDKTKCIAGGAFDSCSSLKTIDIPTGVKRIPNCCFQSSGLTTVNLSNTVESIGANAYQYMSITDIVLPDSVKEVNYSFTYSSSIKNLVIGAGLEKISGEDFLYSNLQTITVSPNNPRFKGSGKELIDRYTNTLVIGCAGFQIPDYVTTIGSYAFGARQGLEGDVVLPSNIMYIEDFAFYNTYFNSIVIPDSVIEMGEYVFNNSYVKSVTLGSGIKEIKDWSFGGCVELTSVTLGNNITYIGDDAFHGCSSLATITISAKVTYIGNDAFSYCDALTSVTFSDPNGWYATTTKGATSGTNLTLTTPSTNATYLKTNYRSYYWYKK